MFRPAARPAATNAQSSQAPRILPSGILPAGMLACQQGEGTLSDRTLLSSMGPMSEPTLKLRVYEGIKQLILSGKLRPGQKLAERDLGERLKVSRTPIREALGRLVQDGLVESRPQRGHFVREVDAKTVEDLYDLREMLEKHAIRLAMRRLSDADLAELDRVGRQLRRFEDDSIQGEEELRE